MRTELAASHCRYVRNQEEDAESRLLVVGHGHLELFDEECFKVLHVLRKDGTKDHHQIYQQFLSRPRTGPQPSWAIEIEHPEARMWASRIEGFQGIIQLLVPVVNPWEQCGTYWHHTFKVSATDDVLRLEPQGRAPIHPVIRDQQHLYGLVREIVRGTQLRVTTIKDEDEWVAGVFRVWDGRYMGNGDIGVGPTEEEALQKLDAHIKERLHSASRTLNYREEEREAFVKIHESWVTPEPSGEWPKR